MWTRKTKHTFVEDGEHLVLRYAERENESHSYVLRTPVAAAMMLEKLQSKHRVADGALAVELHLMLIKRAFYPDLSTYKGDTNLYEL